MTEQRKQPKWVESVAQCAGAHDPEERVAYGKQAIDEIVEWHMSHRLRWWVAQSMVYGVGPFIVGLGIGRVLWGG